MFCVRLEGLRTESQSLHVHVIAISHCCQNSVSAGNVLAWQPTMSVSLPHWKQKQNHKTLGEPLRICARDCVRKMDDQVVGCCIRLGGNSILRSRSLW